MVRHADMTVLIDNIAAEPLAAEWGLSILLTLDGRKLLLDTGAGPAFARNAELLGIDLACVGAGVLPMRTTTTRTAWRSSSLATGLRLSSCAPAAVKTAMASRTAS